MNKKKLANILLFCNCMILACVVCFIPYTTISLFSAKNEYDEQGKYPGEIGLRSYFQKGIGTEVDPYVISRPIHFYNLTRLQNLGVFTSKKYFSLGYDPDGGTNLRFYKSNSASDMQSYLDMNEYSSSPLLSIGSEGTPFYGDFNGNNLVVKNLKVRSGPEDVGVFGYTYTGSNVHNVFFEDLTVTDNGYDTSVTGVQSLFDSTVTGPGSVAYNSVDLVTTENNFTVLDSSFVATMPSTTLTNLKFELRSSSEYITVSKTLNQWSASINQSGSETSIFDNADFYGTSGNRISARLSIVGVLYDADSGISYSRVLSTYLVTFVSGADNSITFHAALDYVTTDSSATYTQYAHGVNIGYLIGHCDGSAKYCFVYNGTLSLNNKVTNNEVAMAQETETGLIGEIGPAIKSEYGQKLANIQSGDTGVINFTKMYTDVVDSSSTFGKTDDYTSSRPVYSYTPVTNNVFMSYLRHTYTTPDNYITGATSSFDFAGQQIIHDEDSVDRGLGVFSLATDGADSSSNDNRLAGLNYFSVAKDTTGVTNYTDIYYTTAEYDDLTFDTQKTTWITDWGYNKEPTKRNKLINAKTIPSDTDSSTWNSDFEKNFNYIIKVPLTASTNTSTGLNDPDYPNYFSSTTSTFLQNYFNYKLINKEGKVPSVTSKDYGVFIKNVNKETKVTSNITTFDSYLKLTSPDTVLSDNGTDVTATSYPFTSIGTYNGVSMPMDTINFSISSEYGANVTVLASSNSGTGGYVSIYDKSIALDATHNTAAYRPALHPNYTMYVPNITNRDDYAYFDYTGGTLSTVATNMYDTSDYGSSGDRLFCHTFKLPKGDYFLTSPYKSANIYYVCAQGQGDNGNYGNQSNIFSNVNTIEQVDFLKQDPINTTNYVYSESDRYKVALKGYFSSGTGDFVVRTSDQTVDGSSVKVLSVSKPSNLTTLYILNADYNYIQFNDEIFKLQYKEYTGG